MTGTALPVLANRITSRAIVLTYRGMKVIAGAARRATDAIVGGECG